MIYVYTSLELSVEPNAVSLRTPVAYFLSAWVKSQLFLLTVVLYYPPGQIRLTPAEINTLGFHCAFSVAVWRWTTSLTPAERSEMDNGFRRTRWGGVVYIQQAIFKLLPPEGKTSHSFFSFFYLCVERTHMLSSAMFCFTLARLHTFGSCPRNRGVVRSATGSCPVKQ